MSDDHAADRDRPEPRSPEPRSPDEQARDQGWDAPAQWHSSDGQGVGREDRAAAHPEVERSSRSRSTAIGLAIALLAGGLLYLAIVVGMTAGG